MARSKPPRCFGRIEFDVRAAFSLPFHQTRCRLAASTFLTWLWRYAPVAGTQPVPHLEELYHRPTAVMGWAAWTAGVAVVAVSIVSQLTWLAEVGAIGLSLGAGLFLANAIRVGAHWRTTQPGRVLTHSQVARRSPTLPTR
jgi:hypothetical protein